MSLIRLKFLAVHYSRLVSVHTPVQVCFGVGVSGSIFCIIRSTPLFGASRSGGVRIFAGQGREQYVLEGIIIALFTLGAAVSLVLMNVVTKIRYSVIRHVGVLMFLSLFVVFSLQIWNAYTDKTRWYRFHETLPADLWTYLSATVKKNSGLLKRALRLSEFYLYEYKDLEGFQKKAKVLVYDYLLRTAAHYFQGKPK